MTSQGPVFTDTMNSGRFWSPAGWDSTEVAPPEAEAARGSIWPVAGGHLLARWEEKNDGDHNVWAVLDGDSGRVQASVLCDKPFAAVNGDPHSAVSPNGRYLVSGHLAFDLDGKKGYCFEESETSKPLTFRSVTEEGTAYGTSRTRDGSVSGSAAPVVLPMDTGTPQPMGSGSAAPVADFAGVGVFEIPRPEGGGLVVHPHKD
ncbi:hypothetical protein ACLGIH_32605 [Streptomyces sp. HMX87]|uniref:hypothetical protein n=1 Tax=Streptomyces sp. HMX87 TaxID=3390849 RepID=UPI003A84105F